MVKVTLECTVCECRMDLEAGGGMNDYDEKIGQTVSRYCQGEYHSDINDGLSTAPLRDFKVLKYQG